MSDRLPLAVTVIGGVQVDVLLSPVTDLPPAGGTSLIDQMSMRVGGAGANAALALVELGMSTRLIGCIGDDELGDWMRGQLAPLGLADELVVVAGGPTGLTVALESSARDRTFLTYLGVNSDWGRIPVDALRCRYLLFCDYFVLPGLRGETGRALLGTAREHGARTFFDTSWDPEGFTSATRDEVMALLPAVDVFLPNEAEAVALAGGEAGDVARAARGLQAVSGGWVVVKRGERGCLAAGPRGVWLEVAAPAVSVADTTGAGDAFNAALVHGLSEGLRWEPALSAATRFASTIVARPSNDRHRVKSAAVLDRLGQQRRHVGHS